MASEILDRANLLAGKAVAHATAYLDGRHDAAKLAQNASALQVEMLSIDDGEANIILGPVKLLNVAMACTAIAPTEARQDKWQQVMGSLVELVRHESRELRVRQNGDFRR